MKKTKLLIEYNNNGIDAEIQGNAKDLVQILTDSAMQNKELALIIEMTYKAYLYNLELKQKELN